MNAPKGQSLMFTLSSAPNLCLQENSTQMFVEWITEITSTPSPYTQWLVLFISLSSFLLYVRAIISGTWISFLGLLYQTNLLLYSSRNLKTAAGPCSLQNLQGSLLAWLFQLPIALGAPGLWQLSLQSWPLSSPWPLSLSLLKAFSSPNLVSSLRTSIIGLGPHPTILSQVRLQDPTSK